MNMTAMLKLFQDMPRCGPGSDACTRQALALIPDLPENPRILDLGCGPGRQTVVLAQELGNDSGGSVTAVDLYPQFVEQVKQNAEAAGVSHLITPRQGDMTDLPDASGSYDLIWAESSIYNMGYKKALVELKKLLKPGGCLACSDLVWLTSSPTPENQEFWQGEYPDMTDLPTRVEQAQGAGYEVLGHFHLSPEVWWDEYYTPLESRLDKFRSRADEIEGMDQMIQYMEREMEMRRKFGHEYGYVFLVLRVGG